MVYYMGFKKRSRNRQSKSSGLNDSRVRKIHKTLWELTDEEYVAKHLLTQCGRVSFDKEKVTATRKRIRAARKRANDRFTKSKLWNSPCRFSAVMETAVWATMTKNFDFELIKRENVPEKLAELVTNLDSESVKLGAKPTQKYAFFLAGTTAKEEFREIKYMFELCFEAMEAILLDQKPTKRCRIVHDYLSICSPDAQCYKCSVTRSRKEDKSIVSMVKNLGKKVIVLDTKYLRIKQHDSVVAIHYYRLYKAAQSIRIILKKTYEDYDDPRKALWVSGDGVYRMELLEKRLLETDYFDDMLDIRNAVIGLITMKSSTLDLLLNDICVTETRPDQYITTSNLARKHQIQRILSLYNCLITGAKRSKKIRVDRPIPIELASKNVMHR